MQESNNPTMQKPNEPNESDIEKRKTEPLHVLKVGVGVKTCPFFTKAGIQNIGDLLQHTSSEDKLKEISTRIEELAVGRSNKYKKWSKIENLKKLKNMRRYTWLSLCLCHPRCRGCIVLTHRWQNT